jgi:4-hydroxythreonine-4-phosphate dehydrogenase
MQNSAIPWIAITQGDAAGIGPEIIAKAFAQKPQVLEGCFVAGDVQVMRRACALLEKPGHPAWSVAQIADLADLADIPPRCVPVFQVGSPMEAVPWGQVSAIAGEFAGRCVQWAADAALAGRIAALVTAPLHKESLAAAGLPYSAYPGHTELLQAASAAHLGKSINEVPVRMMLANDELRTVLVSIHVSMREALDAITHSHVLQTLLITHQALSSVLGRAPRMAVAGLNPHAGEGGLFGREEIDVLLPAMAAARMQGCQLSGPWPPDTVFMRARNRPDHPSEMDVVIAMYHDQGLIPVKYLGVEKGVNVTLGLPLVRTSPDHGTAFDIAGKGLADASSLLEAISMARSLTAIS